MLLRQLASRFQAPRPAHHEGPSLWRRPCMMALVGLQYNTKLTSVTVLQTQTLVRGTVYND